MDILTQVEQVKRTVSTDAYQMSFGEIINLYQDRDIIINPEFQRLFRWNPSQKSRFVESILLGIPIPSVFVYETHEGKWELVDGLQRISTVLEFTGVLRKPDNDGELMPPSVLLATHYLPSLDNAVWEQSEQIADCPIENQVEIGKVLQLSIRRSRIGVEILKRSSDAYTKYDLFQRLNSGGSIANPQELRSCIVVMGNPELFRNLRVLASYEPFTRIIQSSEEQSRRQRDLEYLMRFFVYRYIPYDGKRDVEEYIDSGMIEFAEKGLYAEEVEKNFKGTFDLLDRSIGSDALKQFSDGHFSGRVGLTALEVVAVGISVNLFRILKQNDPTEFVRSKVQQVWARDEVKAFSRAGLRGTYRIQRSIPFGRDWFRPE